MIGIETGQRVAVRVTSRSTPFLDPRDAIKFVCKEFWGYVFGQQASRLQANKKGVFVIYDSNFGPVQSLAKACVTSLGSFVEPTSQLGPLSHPLLVGASPTSEVDESALSVIVPKPDQKHAAVLEKASCKLAVAEGILRGFLQTTGFKCSVEGSVNGALPSCAFTISLLHMTSDVINPGRLLGHVGNQASSRS